MMRKLYSLLFILLSFVLLTSSVRYLFNALNVGAAEKRVNTLQGSSAESLGHVELTLKLPESNVFITTAHSLNTFAHLLRWQGYANNDLESTSLANELFVSSSYLRPTWSNTHVELAKIAMSYGDELESESRMLKSNEFGPHSYTTLSLNVDYVYSNWLSVEDAQRIEATTQLLTLAKSWRYRTELNKMIFYSPGKQRICNMLAFNKLKFDACL